MPHRIYTTGNMAGYIALRCARMGMERVKTGVWCKNHGRIRFVRFFKLQYPHPFVHNQDCFIVEAELE